MKVAVLQRVGTQQVLYSVNMGFHTVLVNKPLVTLVTQDRWKRQVQDQRRRIYDQHIMLN